MRWRLVPGAALALALAVILGFQTIIDGPQSALGQGVGSASWTPEESTTTITEGRFLVPGDAMTYRTDTTWDQAQSEGLASYNDQGLRYTLEINDSSGRLNATGFWATNHPDPAFDRDDDDGDGRWEEAEIIAGSSAPEPGRTYSSLVQFSRWHPKREKGSCVWAWDRRRGSTIVLSQLSRDLLGEWQADRWTDPYDSADYVRVDARPTLGADAPAARCREVRPGDGQKGYVVTFSEPQSWSEFSSIRDQGRGKWLAFEAIGSAPGDDRPWTCGGPVMGELGLRLCKSLGVEVDGVVAAVGYFDGHAADGLRAHPMVADIDDLRDSLTGLLFDIGGFGVERPGLTINDRYWENQRTE